MLLILILQKCSSELGITLVFLLLWNDDQEVGSHGQNHGVGKSPKQHLILVFPSPS